MDNELVWDGRTQISDFSPEAIDVLRLLFDAGSCGEWSQMITVIRDNRELVNLTRPSESSWNTPLHYAASRGAPAGIIKKLVEYGAWRTLINAKGETPKDAARIHGHAGLDDVLDPVYCRQVPREVLSRIQIEFHGIIMKRTGELVQNYKLRLPELEPLLEYESASMWFSVPEMYGGFLFWIDVTSEPVRLISESWSRVATGSGQRHVITETGAELIDSGFV